MEIFLYENELIYILNCIAYSTMKLNCNCTEIERKELKIFFDFNNYDDELYNLNLLFQKLGTKGNKEIYSENNNSHFIGFRDYKYNCKNSNHLDKIKIFIIKIISKIYMK